MAGHLILQERELLYRLLKKEIRNGDAARSETGTQLVLANWDDVILQN